MTSQFTPRETVGELDRYIVGQNAAKRAVAIALRNRWRRQQVDTELRDEISPRNIIMIGPTGVGKTEIARRLAKLARAPFVKVEASKFTEVGYVGRDVESMIRDLVENAIQLCEREAKEDVKTRAEEAAETELCKLILREQAPVQVEPPSAAETTQFGPFKFALPKEPPPGPAFSDEQIVTVRRQLRAHEYDELEVGVEIEDSTNPFMALFGAGGSDEVETNLRDMIGQLPGGRGKTKHRRVPVSEALEVLTNQHASRLVDHDKVQRIAIERTEQAGIVFLDEIDKVSSRSGSHSGADVSREGVQRDLLPIVEGSTVTTKYGPVKTDHVLFIAAGAFHVSNVSDLIPELQGRFPIRVELESLTKADFIRILSEPKNALSTQYVALMATEGIDLSFTPDALEAIADFAAEANRRAENIGARRLQTVMEALLEDLSFDASERGPAKVVVDKALVEAKLLPILGNEDLARYIL